jgi:sterol desaturase/sphingolipid hydroxylase (fatty acid hydroxylase superfamily)
MDLGTSIEALLAYATSIWPLVIRLGLANGGALAEAAGWIQPLRSYQPDAPAWRRIARNTGLHLGWLVVSRAATLGLGYLLAERISQQSNLMSWLGLTDGWRVAAGVVLMDFFTYGFHVIEHKVPWIWRFHQLHHLDPHVDLSTALRKHPLAAVFTNISITLFMVSLGIPFFSVALYAIIGDLFGLLGHSNSLWLHQNRRWFRRLGLVAPSDHKVHHSTQRDQTDSNFGQVWIIWDRIFGTYCQHDEPDFDYGVEPAKR